MGPDKPDAIPRAKAFFSGSDTKLHGAQLSATTTLYQNLPCQLQGDSGGMSIFLNIPGNVASQLPREPTSAHFIWSPIWGESGVHRKEPPIPTLVLALTSGV